MAGKRRPEPLHPVAFPKLPRLEPEPGLCKAPALPDGPGAYEGSCFSCPLAGRDAPEPLARWSPAAAYLPCAAGPPAACPRYRREAGSPGARPPADAHECLVRELLLAREPWGGPPGLKKPLAALEAGAPARRGTLAVPKPVYGTPVCYLEPRPPLALRAADWALRSAPELGSPGAYYGAVGVCGPPCLAAAHRPPAKAAREPDTWAPLGAPTAGGFAPYALPLRGPGLLYPPPPPALEQRPGAPIVPMPGGYRGFPASDEPPLPSAYVRPPAPGGCSAGASEGPEPRRPLPGFAFAPPSEGHGAPDKAASAFQPVGAPDKVPRGAKRLLETFAPVESPYGLWSAASERELPPPETRRAGLAPTGESNHGAPGVPPPAPMPTASSPVRHVGSGEAPGAREAAGELGASPEPPSPEGRRRDQQGETGPSSPPMPVINNVFSLAPYREYLEGPAEVPVGTEHGPRCSAGGSPGRRDSCGAPPVPAGCPAGSGAALPGEGGPCSQRAPPGHNVTLLPRGCLVGRGPSPQDGSTGPAVPGEVVLDLSLKRRLVRAGQPPGPAGLVNGTSEGEGAAGRQEEAPRPAEAGEGAKAQPLPLLVEVGPGDKSNFQSSATFMFKKYKILKCLPPGAVRPVAGAAAAAPSGPCASPRPRAEPRPSSSVLRVACLDLQLAATSQPLLPAPPEAPRVPGEDNVSVPGHGDAPGQQSSASQYFTALHASLCNVISCSVSGSSPELLQEWLRRTQPEEELREMPESPPKPKNGPRLPEPHKATKGKEIWLAFKDVAALLSKLLSQLETFMFTRKCPFPHVVRAGAIFIPIHVVKEKLFPKLPGPSVDQVLQEHKVELRPTTLSEEKLLRELELKSCTSRMLKLLALKQLPDIYPDLLNLHWHDSVKQHLGR
ncbi:uncharacterized protein C15orf39 homolog [Eudromia elegans]